MDRLKKRADFLAAAQGPRVARPAFIVQSRLRNDTGSARIGFTVSKKVGTATERNRVRRRLREIVKHADVMSLPLPRDYVIVGRRSALERDFGVMIDDLRSAMLRLARPPADQPGPSALQVNSQTAESHSAASYSAKSRARRPHKTGPQRPDQ
ncbi:MAG: ribonuclease P protein component [Xanthobacteraceae bacterium]|nr:ribonuclease P protein component [Xanthobacteraceae bacterium]